MQHVLQIDMPGKEPYQHSAMFPVQFTYKLYIPISWSLQTQLAGPSRHSWRVPYFSQTFHSVRSNSSTFVVYLKGSQFGAAFAWLRSSSSPLTLKGVEDIVGCSKARDDNKCQSLDNISEPVNIFVHEKCCQDYTRSRTIEKQKRKTEGANEQHSLCMYF